MLIFKIYIIKMNYRIFAILYRINPQLAYYISEEFIFIVA